MTVHGYSKCIPAFSSSLRMFLLLTISFLIGLATQPLLSQTNTQTLTLTAVDADGTNTGNARLGVNVAITTAITQSTYPVRTWTLTGAGTLQSSATNNANATYTPPTTMPANPTVTITATLAGNPPSYPAVVTSYTLTLVNPIPKVSSAAPAQAAAGATIPVTLTGTGFVPGTVIMVGGTAVSTTYQSPTSVTAQVSAPAGSSSPQSLTAQNPSPLGGTGNAFSLPTSAITVTATNPNGSANNGTAVLGTPVSFTTSVVNSPYGNRAWSTPGPGTLVTSATENMNATYTPPTSIPSSGNVVTVNAYMSSYPTLATSYTLTLLNPVPTVTSASPAQLVPGGTQTVTLSGSGFVPGATVAFNGATLPVTYVSFTSATVQVPVPPTATGKLSLQIQNPSPGGGSGSTFTESTSTPAITLTAPNSGAVALGSTLQLTSSVTNSLQTAVTWSVSGGGSISTSGVYTAPAAMPTGVTVTATLASNTAVTATYSPSLINPVPQIGSAAPAQAAAGATIPVTVTGTGFVSGTVVLVGGTAVPTTYQSPTSVIAQVTAPAGSSSPLSLLAQNPSPAAGTGSAFSLPTSAISLTATNPNGSANNGTAVLGTPVSFTTSVVNSPYGSRAWTLTGGGTLQPSAASNVNATYTPPASIPSSGNVVTINAYMSSYPTLATSYTLTLLNPVPTVTSVTPAQLVPGGTQTVTLTGSGFVPGMTVTLNGATLSTTYVSSTRATLQVPVSATANGTLSLQIQNPSPGGGSTVFAAPVATPAITLTAPNSGTVALGSNLQLTSSVASSLQTAVTWSVSGGGSISTSGVYTAPAAMPTGSVIVTATLVSNTAITATYSPSLINPVPQIGYTTPGQAAAGATIPIAISGYGFVPGTVILVGGTAVPTTYQSSTSLTAQVAAPAGSSSPLSLTPQNPSPAAGIGNAFSLPTSVIVITATNPNGSANNGTAVLGTPVSFTASVVNSPYGNRTWNAQGPGTLLSSGTESMNATYTPPTSIPSTGNVVTVNAYMSSYPTLAASYTLTLLNPVPTVTSATPAQLLPGGTQTVTLSGSGFVPGTTVAFNGTTLPITYVSSSSASIQVPVSATATGTLSLQIQNPSPGGGLGSTFTETVASPAITLTATDADGTNTGTAELGVNVVVTPTITGTELPALSWSLSNTSAGSLSSGGVYTAPPVMPQDTRVTITATLVSNPSVTASYVLHIIYPVPVLTSASPVIVPAGDTTLITLTGSNFEPGTVVEANGVFMPTTYISPTSLQAQVSVPSTATGNDLIQAFTGTPGGGSSAFVPVAISAAISETAAARLLDQTTFGPTTSLIQQVEQEGENAWLTQQFNTPQTVLPPIPNPLPSYCGDSAMCFESSWWNAVLTGNDQLRQRVAFALSQLFVVSSDTVPGTGINYYHNLLAADAFTNWYTIMTDVTLSPAMGIYLDMLNSVAPSSPTLIADENYARENMQLFNLGLDLINQDGSLQLDGNGNPIPAYTQAQVQAFARAYTGWVFANADGSTPSGGNAIPNYTHPLVAVEIYHEENPKTVLSGTTLPAGQTAEQDMAGALTNIFQHPNLPPFVSQQLIQHLVKSDPSPAYISRVAAVFINDGNNVRGDMQAVLTAIFTDPEARAGDTSPQTTDGHLREPILWLTDAMRGLGYVNVDPNNFYQYLSNYSGALGEWPYQSPAVFNFFPPSYVIPGTTLNAPEFGLENTASVTVRLTQADQLVNNKITGFNVDLSATSPLGQIAVSQGPSGLVSALNALFLYNTMDANTITAITNEISSVTNPAQQVRIAAYLVLTSSEYKILH